MQDINSNDQRFSTSTKRSLWPCSGDTVANLLWTNVFVNIGLVVLALHPEKNIKKVELLFLALLFFNSVFFSLVWLKVRLSRRLTEKDNNKKEGSDPGTFYRQIGTSLIIMVFTSMASWSLLYVIGFDRWYAIPIALGLSLMIHTLL